MELLDGVPTLIGGFNSEAGSYNDVLYQYKDNDWLPLSAPKMRIPRSTAAVFQVPKSLADNC